MDNGTVSSGSASDGFLASVSSGLGTGIGKIFSEVLPVWTASQAGLQANDQLDKSTYIARDDVPKIYTGPTTGGKSTVQSAVSGLGLGSVPVYVIVGMALAVGFAVYFVAKK